MLAHVMCRNLEVDAVLDLFRYLFTSFGHGTRLHFPPSSQTDHPITAREIRFINFHKIFDRNIK